MKNFKYISFFIALFLTTFVQAQSLLELTGGQELSGSSAFQKQHSDLDKYNASSVVQEQTTIITQAPQNANALSVTRLPDLKLNENFIRKTVIDYSLDEALKSNAQLYALGSREEAIKRYEIIAASAQQGANAQAAAELAVIYLQKADFKKALSYIHQASEADKQNPFYQLIKIWILAADLKYKEAQKEYERLLFLTADFEYLFSAKTALAGANFYTNKKGPATELYQDIYSTNPYIISHAVYNLGRINFSKKKYNTAQVLFEQALRHDIYNYMAQKYNAMAEEKLKQYTSAWQSYASLYILDTKDKAMAKKLKKLSKHLKADPENYLFFTRLSDLFQKKPDFQEAAHIRVGLFTRHDGTLTEVQSFSFLSGAAFSIKDEKLGKVISGEAFTPKTITFDAENQGAQIQNKWNTPEFSTKRPFLIDMDKEGYTILIKDIKADNIFAANTGDKELKGKILVIPTDKGMKLINYTTLEDILPAILMSVTRGIKNIPALEAVAIALRTRLTSELKNSAFNSYDIPDNSPVMQYGGINMQAQYVKKAVQNTKDLILTEKIQQEEEIIMPSVSADLGLQEVAATPPATEKSTENLDTAPLQEPQPGQEQKEEEAPVQKITLPSPLAEPKIYKACSVVTEDGIRNTETEVNYTYSPVNLFKFSISNPPMDLFSAPEDPTAWAAIKWTYAIPLKDIENRLKQNHKIGRLKSISPAEISPSGRIIKMRFTGSKGSVDIAFDEANFILASGSLRSNFFTWIPFGKNGKTKEYLFIGTDTGMGKGLCIDGAQGMAKEGKTSAEILKYYYPDLNVTKEWAQEKSHL